MVVGWKLPENVGATRSETGAFAVYVRTCVGHWRVANYKYVQVCGSETGIKSLDGTCWGEGRTGWRWGRERGGRVP